MMENNPGVKIETRKKRMKMGLINMLRVGFMMAWIALSLLPAGSISAQAPQPTPSDNEVNRVAKQLYCPVCENIPLDVCPTQACAEWRELIRQKLGEGWSDAQIKEYFSLQYGDRVLAEPPRRGLNWIVYVLPPVFLLGGVVLLYSVLRRMRGPAVKAQAFDPQDPTQIHSDPYLNRVEEELKKQQS